jgi:very-short-patch-repair endonuclease
MTQNNPGYTTLTGPHLELLNILGNLELDYIEEKRFHPYVVDAYIPDLHVAFEADGPQHSIPRDEKRDTYLASTYALPVIRLETVDLTTRERAYKALLMVILEGAFTRSALDRIEYARKNGWSD